MKGIYSLNKIDRLKTAYSKHIHIPWRDDASPEERVIFCVYSENDELILRSRVEEFAIETRDAGHKWLHFDLTNSFSTWLTSQKYGEQYFKRPELIMSTISGYASDIEQSFRDFLAADGADENTVVAITGVGTLFGFLKVRDVVATFAPLVSGRLVVFFPGNYENNNYRLLDAYDGWNYLAVPITSDTDIR